MHLWNAIDAKDAILTALSMNGEGWGEVDELSKNEITQEINENSHYLLL